MVRHRRAGDSGAGMKTMRMLVLAVSLLGCSGSGDDFQTLVCDAGKTQPCTCDNGDKGAQVCAEDGTKWGECSCGSAGAGGSGGAGATGGATSSGGKGGASGAATSGSGGAAGADQKECSTDEDCP